MREIQEHSERMNETLLEAAEEGTKRPDWTHGAAANEAILERTREILEAAITLFGWGVFRFL